MDNERTNEQIFWERDGKYGLEWRWCGRNWKFVAAVYNNDYHAITQNPFQFDSVRAAENVYVCIFECLHVLYVFPKIIYVCIQSPSL